MPDPTETKQLTGTRSGMASRLPLLGGCGLFLALLAIETTVGTRSNGGVFCYTLDDAYIHLAIARSLAQHGIWGLNPAAGFASASSSPGWTLLLAACVRLFGDRVWLSLALNAAFALAILTLADFTMRRWLPSVSPRARFCLQTALVLLVPLPSLALVGMEHSAQAFAVLAMLVAATEIAATLPLSSGRSGSVLLAATFLAAALRYETIFAVVAVLVLLLGRRRWGMSVSVAGLAALPPLLFGIYASHYGPFWLPYSVLAKADINHLQTAWIAWTHFVPFGPKLTLSALTIASLALFPLVQNRRSRALTVLYVIVYVLHLTLAPIGWLMRYEGYLVAVGCLTVAMGAAELWPGWISAVRNVNTRKPAIAVAILAVALVYPAWLDRAWTGVALPAEAMHDRFLEHMQPALFLGANYDHVTIGHAAPDPAPPYRATIVASDIGMISYYSGVQVLDPIGLGSPEPLLARRASGRFTAEQMQRWAASSSAAVAVIETGWEQAAAVVPAQWIPVETWHFPRNVVYSNREVTFFATTRETAPALRQALDSWQLPPGLSRSAP